MQSVLDLKSLPLSIGHINKLSAAGFETVGDLKDVGIVELSKDTGLSHAEALEVVRVARDSGETAGKATGTSALELLKSEVESSHIVTFSSQVDSMLGGGVAVSRITELCGAPGVGKTQFCMQLAVDVAIPEVFGGLAGEAIYIDTEGSFVVERVADMARAAVAHLHTVAASNQDQEMSDALTQFTLEHVLSGMYYYRCHDYIELVALINVLPKILSHHPRVRVILIDSIASPFRYGFQDMGLRNRILSGLSQILIQLAVTKHIAVVLSNQMTTKITGGQPANKTAQLIPALGESWGHVCTVRVVLYWCDGVRHAWLLKSPTQREQSVPYQITVDGVRDAQASSSSTPDPPPTQLVTQRDDFEFTDDCLDELMAGVPDSELVAGSLDQSSNSLKRKLEEGTYDIRTDEYSSTALDVEQQLAKRPHPEH